MLKKIPSDKINGTIPSFFFHELQLIRVLLLICDSYNFTVWVYPWKFHGLSIFDSVPFLLEFILLFNKMQELFNFKTS